jgi:SAM-dependent methyltransferase
MCYVTTAERGSPDSQRTASRFFAEPMREYVLQCLGRPVSVLQAGCLAPLRELGIAELTQGGFAVSVTAVDSDQPLARRVLLDMHSVYDDVITGDLRTVSIPQRAFDVVYCAALLERVRHVELVLDRLTSALKPGGLLFVRTADRYSATALLDRVLPGPARRAVWSRFRPGIPGPFPAVYEKTVSEEGITSYALMRGLVIAARGSELTRPDQPPGLSSSVRITCAAIARLSRGRYDDGHDELLYVIRKPLDRFARVVLAHGVAETPRRRRAWPYRTCCPLSWPRGRPGPRERSSSASSSCSSPARSRRWPGISPPPTSRRSVHAASSTTEPRGRFPSRSPCLRVPCPPTQATWCCRTRRARRSPSSASPSGYPPTPPAPRCAWQAR